MNDNKHAKTECLSSNSIEKRSNRIVPPISIQAAKRPADFAQVKGCCLKKWLVGLSFNSIMISFLINTNNFSALKGRFLLGRGIICRKK
jgi:hypothetical protein